MGKQVIIIRKDLRNKDGHKVNKGKLVAQGAHASLKAVLDLGDWVDTNSYLIANMPSPMVSWMKGSFTKVVLGCESEEEMLELYQKALDNDIPCSLIKDAGRTEFSEPTHTCIAIGPFHIEDVDKISGHLKLYR